MKSNISNNYKGEIHATHTKKEKNPIHTRLANTIEVEYIVINVKRL